nr:GNAT family N-acetyltransferase [Eubacterium sp.]
MIEGNRVNLRPITETDTSLIVKWRNNKRVFDNFVFSERLNEEMHKKWLEEKVKTGLVEQFIIIEKESNK